MELNHGRYVDKPAKWFVGYFDDCVCKPVKWFVKDLDRGYFDKPAEWLVIYYLMKGYRMVYPK